ncbi:MAG: hypothetical protein KQ78_02140 [Candidatus Izimaplasma bacterium HR2]|nr:MAG: hypothetical protein KQ78_02140 [Candidatus Izimaplasma bacterium HR2]
MKFKEFLDVYNEGVILVEVNMTNYNNLDTPIYVKRYNGYLFYVDDIEFIFRGFHTEDNKWTVKFGVHKGNGDINVDMSEKYETKNTILILNYVAKCLSMFTKQYKPNQITFVADRKNRQKIYDRLIQALLKEPEFQYYGFPRKIDSEVDNTVVYIMKRS